MGHKAKWEYFRAVYERYRKAGREAKQVMLNEFCLNTGYNRKYAIRLLNGPPPGKQPERRPRGRRPRYGQQVLSIFADLVQRPHLPEGVLESDQIAFSIRELGDRDEERTMQILAQDRVLGLRGRAEPITDGVKRYPTVAL